MKRKVYLTLVFTLALFVSSYANSSDDAALKSELMQPASELFDESIPQLAQGGGGNGGGGGGQRPGGGNNQQAGANGPAAKKPAAIKEPAAPAKEPSAFAQKFDYGFYAGSNFSFLSEGTHVRVSFVGGIFGQYEINDKLDVVLEAAYSDQGAQVYVLKEDGMTKYRHFTGLKYLNVPLMLQYNVYGHFNLKLGFQAGYLMRAKYLWRKMTRFETWTIEEGYNKFDYAIPIALSYHFDSGIYFEGRYTHGLTTITCLTSNPLDVLPDYKNRNFSLTIGYKF